MTKPNVGSRIFLLISFISLYYFSVHSQQAPTLARLNQQQQLCHTDTGRTNLLQQLAALYINQPGVDPEDTRLAAGYASQALAISTKQHYPDGQAGSLTLLAQIAREKGDTAKAREYIDKALTSASNAAPWPAMAAACQEKAIQLSIYETPQQKVHYYSLYLEELKQHEQRSLKLADALKYYAIGALLLLLLLISIWAYHIKRRANLQLQQQQFEINQQNITLKELLDERDWLLKEVHHRVKNNLQIVISLLNTQALHLNNETARQALRESRNRMQAISIIHQKLYRSDSFSGVNMHFYLNELLEYLQDSFSIHDMVTLEINPDFTELDVSQVVPIGLIINEAVTNAIKYALPSTAQPHIHISLRCEDAQVTVTIADNGPGLPADFDPETSTSFGLNLIIGLVRQLRGKVEFDSSAGLQIKLSFQQSCILL